MRRVLALARASMITGMITGLLLGLLAVLASCSEEQTAKAPPPPQELTAAAIGHYCGMQVTEHPGPKAQILLTDRNDPVWFSSARDAFAFTMLPEEPKNIAAVYVTDMGKAASWDHPGPGTWVDAHRAVYVIGSSRRGGMGAEEAVPFADEATARQFAAQYGGEVVPFDKVPRDYVLGAAEQQKPASGHGDRPAGGHSH